MGRVVRRTIAGEEERVEGGWGKKKLLNRRCLVNAITFHFCRGHFWPREEAPFAPLRYDHRAKQKATRENVTSGGIKVKVA